MCLVMIRVEYFFDSVAEEFRFKEKMLRDLVHKFIEEKYKDVPKYIFCKKVEKTWNMCMALKDSNIKAYEVIGLKEDMYKCIKCKMEEFRFSIDIVELSKPEFERIISFWYENAQEGRKRYDDVLGRMLKEGWDFSGGNLEKLAR